MQRDQAVIDRWSGAAPFWEKHHETIRQMFAPITQALIDDAWIDNAHSVLDVATGEIPLAEARQAQELLGQGGVMGKIVLVCSGQ
jgi:hypothetical protein